MNDSIITATVVPDEQRVQHTAELFGVHFPMRLEPFVFSMAEEDSLGISEHCVEYYDCSVGSNWEMMNGGIY